MNKVWSESYPIHTYELDRRQKVSIHAVCSYLIDTAGHHVHELGFSIPQLLEKRRSWFFSRFLLRLEAYPGWRDTITVETWPPGSQKLLALREWRLLCGGETIGAGTSGWLMIDIEKRRPLRPESYPEWKQFIHPERIVVHSFGRLPSIDASAVLSGKREFSVRFDDVDLNGHANYLCYIDWILESLPPELRQQRELAELEVHFLREANYAEKVISCSTRIGKTRIHPITVRSRQDAIAEEYLHAVVLQRPGCEAVRARTVWKQPR